jgi:hypothetical protein
VEEVQVTKRFDDVGVEALLDFGEFRMAFVARFGLFTDSKTDWRRISHLKVDFESVARQSMRFESY